MFEQKFQLEINYPRRIQHEKIRNKDRINTLSITLECFSKETSFFGAVEGMRCNDFGCMVSNSNFSINETEDLFEKKKSSWTQNFVHFYMEYMKQAK